MHLRSRSRPVRASLTLVLLAAGCWLTGAPPAQAHTELLRSEPPAGASLAQAPREVRLVFTEDVQPRYARIAVTGPAGNDVAAGAPRVTGSTVLQALTAAMPGAYAVAYRVVSADGHPVSGQLSFTVQSGGGAQMTLAGAQGATAGASSTGPVSPSPARTQTTPPGTAEHDAPGHPGSGTVGRHLGHLLVPVLMLIGATVAGVRTRRQRPHGTGGKR